MDNENGDLIKNIVNEINIELNKANTRLLISDAIDIYNGKYFCYDTYKEIITKENNKYDSLQNIDFDNHKTNFTFYAKHIILDEFVFNTIINEKLNRRKDNG